MKKFEFIYLDHQGNELERSTKECYSKKDATELASNLLASTRLNDLKEIKTRLVKH